MKLSFCECLYSINAFCTHLSCTLPDTFLFMHPQTQNLGFYSHRVSAIAAALQNWYSLLIGVNHTRETCRHRYRRSSVWINPTAGLNEPNYWFENALKQLNKKQNILQCDVLKFVKPFCFCDWTFLIRSSIYKLHWTYYIFKPLSNYVILFLFVNKNSRVIKEIMQHISDNVRKTFTLNKILIKVLFCG